MVRPASEPGPGPRSQPVRGPSAGEQLGLRIRNDVGRAPGSLTWPVSRLMVPPIVSGPRAMSVAVADTGLVD
jgi:hypothetical protein